MCSEIAKNQTPSRKEIWRMFDRIAHRYDLLNHLLSLNRDKAWRKRLTAMLPPGDNLRVLDLACGTGDQLLDLYESGRVTNGVGLDPSEKMLATASEKIKTLGLGPNLSLEPGVAEEIPFDDNCFDAITISFGIRNVLDLEKSLSEMLRVLKPGGRCLILEFSLPANGIARALYLFYFRKILPVLGGAISGDSEAYRYLNRTVETFPYGEQFCRKLRLAGFAEVTQQALTFGVASIYSGQKEMG